MRKNLVFISLLVFLSISITATPTNVEIKNFDGEIQYFGSEEYKIECESGNACIDHNEIIKLKLCGRELKIFKSPVSKKEKKGLKIEIPSKKYVCDVGNYNAVWKSKEDGETKKIGEASLKIQSNMNPSYKGKYIWANVDINGEVPEGPGIEAIHDFILTNQKDAGQGKSSQVDSKGWIYIWDSDGAGDDGVYAPGHVGAIIRKNKRNMEYYANDEKKKLVFAYNIGGAGDNDPNQLFEGSTFENSANVKNELNRREFPKQPDSANPVRRGTGYMPQNEIINAFKEKRYGVKHPGPFWWICNKKSDGVTVDIKTNQQQGNLRCDAGKGNEYWRSENQKEDFIDNIWEDEGPSNGWEPVNNCQDGIDNDGDGNIDAYGTSNAPADDSCSGDPDRVENYGCAFPVTKKDAKTGPEAIEENNLSDGWRDVTKDGVRYIRRCSYYQKDPYDDDGKEVVYDDNGKSPVWLERVAKLDKDGNIQPEYLSYTEPAKDSGPGVSPDGGCTDQHCAVWNDWAAINSTGDIDYEKENSQKGLENWEEETDIPEQAATYACTLDGTGEINVDRIKGNKLYYLHDPGPPVRDKIDSKCSNWLDEKLDQVYVSVFNGTLKGNVAQWQPKKTGEENEGLKREGPHFQTLQEAKKQFKISDKDGDGKVNLCTSTGKQGAEHLDGVNCKNDPARPYGWMSVNLHEKYQEANKGNGKISWTSLTGEIPANTEYKGVDVQRKTVLQQGEWTGGWVPHCKAGLQWEYDGKWQCGAGVTDTLTVNFVNVTSKENSDKYPVYGGFYFSNKIFQQRWNEVFTRSPIKDSEKESDEGVLVDAYCWVGKPSQKPSLDSKHLEKEIGIPIKFKEKDNANTWVNVTFVEEQIRKSVDQNKYTCKFGFRTYKLFPEPITQGRNDDDLLETKISFTKKTRKQMKKGASSNIVGSKNIFTEIYHKSENPWRK